LTPSKARVRPESKKLAQVTGPLHHLAGNGAVNRHTLPEPRTVYENRLSQRNRPVAHTRCVLDRINSQGYPESMDIGNLLPGFQYCAVASTAFGWV
jgi:hypothetical protein